MERKIDRTDAQAPKSPTEPLLKVNDDYTVGWICALRTEYVAARALLDKIHGKPEYVSPKDENIYTLGEVGKHNVVVAVLPDGEYGIATAANVAGDMMTSFPNLRFSLLVGIGGGAPTPEHDIRLGDIVVGAPLHGKGGMIQYDFGKTIQGKKFHETGVLNQPPRLLKAAVNDLGAQYEEEGHHLEDAITTALNRLPRLQNRYRRPDNRLPRLQNRYRRPDQRSDKLYQSNFIHQDDNSGCEATCGNDQLNLISRPERSQEEDNPAIHYGLIASANQLMKDAMTRDKLAAEKNVLCFEMEAAGLMNHFPCLVIRGICDYADSHKNKEWQGYAAMVAAAYAKDLLCRIPQSKINAQDKIINIISGIGKDINALLYLQHHQEHQYILDWLTPYNFIAQQNDYLRERQLGTGKWFLESSEYQAWLQTKSQTLFCPGIPGAGKTIIASIVVEHLQTDSQNNFRQEAGEAIERIDDNIGIAYLYCSFQRRQQQTLEDLLLSLLKQLSQQQFKFPQIVDDLYKTHRVQRTRPTVNEISSTLQSVAIMYSRIFIVMDALDECETSNQCRENLLSEIFKLQTKTGANLLITSRLIPDIMDKFKEYPSLEIRAHDTDVIMFLEGNMSQLPQPCVQNNSKLQESIKNKISKAADGMFLLARLYLDALIDKTTQDKILDTLETLPQGPGALNQAYTEAIKRIKCQRKDFRELAETVLLWVTCAKRLLTTSELQHGLAVKTGKSSIDENDFEDTNQIVSLCAGLVTIDKESDIIRVVHDTTREYLQDHVFYLIPGSEEDFSTPVLQRQKNSAATGFGHSAIAGACITYLSYEVFKSGHCQTDADFKQRLQLYPFYGYAAHNWGHHVRGTSMETEPLTLHFLRNNANVSAAGEAILDCRDYDDHRLGVKNTMIGVHHSAYFGLRKALQTLISEGCYADLKDAYGWTPLSWAARQGYESIARWLLEKKDVDPDSVDNNGRTPMSWAAEKGHLLLVELLLATRGVNPDFQDLKGQTPLSWAAKHGNTEVVELLLCTNRVNVNAADSEYHQTALLWAAENGHSGVVEQLLKDKDIEPNHENIDGETALMLAAENSHQTTIQLLLKNGADTEAKNKKGRTLLWWAVENGNETTANILLKNGANIEAKNKKGRTLLWWAVENENEAMVNLLLKNCANIEARDGALHYTPLIYAARQGYEAVVKLLLEEGADIEAKDGVFHCTALILAARQGHEAVVKLLLEKGANIEAKDTVLCYTPLMSAAREGHEAVVKLLLEKGADIKAKDIELHYTPLILAAREGHEAVVKLLLEKGADIKAGDGELYYTPLIYAARGGHEAVVTLLLEKGADTKAKDTEFYYTLLTLAARQGHKAVIKNRFEQLPAFALLNQPLQELEQGGLDGAAVRRKSGLSSRGKTGASIARSSVNKSKSFKDEVILEESNNITEEPGLNSRLLKEPTPVSMGQTGDKTESSAAASLNNSKKEQFVSQLVDQLLSDALFDGLDKQSMKAICSSLQDLLEIFALKIGFNAQSQIQRDIMYYTHKHSKDIVHLFETQLHDRDRGRDEFATRMALETVQNKTRDWVDNLENPKIADTQNMDDDRFRENRIDQVYEDGEDAGFSDLDAFRDHISGSPAYGWLLAILKREALMEKESSHSLKEIKQKIVSYLRPSSKISKSRSAETFHMRFLIDWDPISFLREQQYQGSLHETIEKVITLTGSTKNAQALTTLEYLRQTWPTTGEHILQLVQDVLREPQGQKHTRRLLEGTELTAWIASTEFIAEASGTAASIAEIGEQLAWLSASLRTSPRDTGITSYTPSIHIIQTEVTSSRMPNQSVQCLIKYTREDDPDHLLGNGRCWHNMFKNPILVKGFPVPRRPNPDTGLEISLDMMSALANAQRVDEFDGKIFIKGFSTMLIPTDYIEGIIIWHMQYNKDGKHISYFDTCVPHTSIEISDLEQSRNIVGWCSQAKLFAGTEVKYNVQRSGLPRPTVGVVLNNISISGGKYITAGANFTIGARDKPIHVQREGHESKLLWIHDNFIVLWDEKCKRGWLVKGTTALLYLSRAALNYYQEGPLKGNLVFNFRALEEVTKRLTPESAIRVLANESILNLEIWPNSDQHSEDDSKKKNRFRDLTDNLYNILEKMIDYQVAVKNKEGVRLNRKIRRALDGWEFDDIANIRLCEPRVATLEETGDDWARLISEIGAVALFGEDFGEIIQPSSTEGLCKRWIQMPENEYFLGACVSDLANIIRLHGAKGAEQIKFTDNISWHSPVESFGPCQCSDTTNLSACNLAQELRMPKDSQRPLSNSSITKHLSNSQGAVIFSPKNQSISKWGYVRSFLNPFKKSKPPLPPKSILNFEQESLAFGSSTSGQYDESLELDESHTEDSVDSSLTTALSNSKENI